MVLRFNLFLKELSLFVPTLILGIFSAYNNAPLAENSLIEPPIYTWDSIVIFLVFFAIISFFIFKFKKIGHFSFRFFLLLVIFSGTQIIFSSFVASPWDLLWALAAVFIFMTVKNVLVHDLGIILGIAGVASVLGISITPITVVVILVILSFYDIIAVYVTKHMVYMARGMMESGAIFGFIIPFNWSDAFYHKGEAQQQVGDRFMILGSGDIGLPVVMVSSLALVSVWQAIITAIFVLIGLFLTHIIFVNQSGRRPMAALPPIATLTIIGYLISNLI